MASHDKNTLYDKYHLFFIKKDWDEFVWVTSEYIKYSKVIINKIPITKYLA